MTDGVNIGDMVVFTGFTGSDDAPDNAEALTEGETYKVKGFVEAEDDDNLDAIVLEAPNPNFDDSKRASAKANPRTVDVEVFDDEIEAVAEEQEEEKAPAKKTTTKKKAAAKKPAAKKTAAKAKAAPKSKLKEPTEGDEEEAAPKQKLERGMVLLQEHEEDEDVLTLIDEADDIIELAREQVEEAQHADYILGGVLYHVRIDESYKELDDEYAGNAGFAKFVEAELGVKYRKAMHLIEIYTAFSRFGIKGEVVGEIGWTKAMEISRVMDEDNAEELVDVARESSVTDLKDAISDSYAKKGSDQRQTVKRTSFKFRLLEESGSTITGYLQQAKEELGLEDMDAVFEHIVTEWATANLNIKKTRKTTKKAPAKTAARKPAAKAKAAPKAKAKAPARKTAAKKPTRKAA